MNQAFQKPEVQEALKVLSQHGMGAMHIHMHNENGDLVPLQDGVVQLESDLEVSFVSVDDPRLKDATLVAWQHKEGEIVVTAYCQKNHGRCIVDT
ncbi:MAG: hypothetical protein GVY11_01825 [Gammaproteobacteria bacterium]|jgi:hypothetical protein|nr:hypothetical protein [Gammaproteobacteria bacterium]